MTAPYRHRSGRAAATAAAFLATVGLAACSRDHPPITGCEPAAGLTPDCRFQNPEDLAASPGGGLLLVSQMAATDGSAAGALAAYDPTAGTVETLFPLERVSPAPAEGGWGEPSCPPAAPDVFAPHGFDLETLADGRKALYVVNHGGRESVEMFEVHENGELRLTWRGCVIAPEGGNFNDLVVLRDGGFWVSQMFPASANVLWTALRMQVTGHTPGYVYHWRPGQGFQQIAGTETAFANGVEKSEDERFLFVNSYFGDAVNKVDVATGELMGSAPVRAPDNLTWSPGGELLVASHHASIPDLLACQDLERGNCGFPFQILAIDPASMQPRVLLDHAGPPMGAATVALPFGDGLYLGTFAGDRITRAPASILFEPEG